MKIHVKGFLVVSSLIALTFTSALFADDRAAERNLFERFWQAVVDELTPETAPEEPVEKPVETEAGPFVIFVG